LLITPIRESPFPVIPEFDMTKVYTFELTSSLASFGFLRFLLKPYAAFNEHWILFVLCLKDIHAIGVGKQFKKSKKFSELNISHNNASLVF